MNASDEIARGWDLFRLGAFTEAESLLARHGDHVKALRLQLWIAIRRGDVEKKRDCGSRLAQAHDPSLAAVGRAHENVALASLRLPMQPWLTPRSPWSRSEVAYARALVAFTQGRSSDLRDELAKEPPHTPEQRVRYSQLRAWQPAISDEFVRQAVGLVRSLRMALEGEVDRTLTASIASSLAFLVREVELGDIAPLADTLLARVEWPQDNTTYQFYGQWAMAWRKATLGEWIPAINLLNQTLLIAPNKLSEALIHADRARIRAALGERVSVTSSRMFAHECLRTIDWSTAINGEALATLSMMDILALDIEPALALFESLSQAKTSRLLADEHGRRYDAFRNFAQSHLTCGEASLRHAQDAYRLFKGMKYIHRAGDCALRAVEVGGGARWRRRVERINDSYPRSLTARAYERTASPLNQIRGRRRELLDLLATSTKPARELGRSIGMGKETVRDHVKAIYRALQIENRLQLVRLYIESEGNEPKSASERGEREAFKETKTSTLS